MVDFSRVPNPPPNKGKRALLGDLVDTALKEPVIHFGAIRGTKKKKQYIYIYI